MRPRAALVLALALALPGSARAAAADPGEAVRAASARIAEAGRELDAAKSAPDRVAALGRAIRAYETALAALRASVTDAGTREQTLAVDLEARRAPIARLLAALEAMSRTPPPAQAMHPQGPLGAARAAAMMTRLTPALQAEAERVSRQLDDLEAARRLHEEGSADLAAGLDRLNAAHAALSEAMAASSPVPSPNSPLEMMARDSETLTALAAALAGSKEGATPPAAEGEAQPMSWPLAGEIKLHFNERDAAGVRRPGLVLRAPPLSLVTAPADAIVRYAGPFLEYGYVVVMAPDAGTMLVLAGLANLEVRTGEAVRRGDLLGLLGGRALDVEEYVMLPEADTGAGGGETLYIEVRHGRGPVDPEPLFAGETDRKDVQ